MKYEKILFKLCKKAEKRGEVPVAALITDEEGKIISKSYNKREKSKRFLDHAEIRCLIKANKCLKNKFLPSCSIYVTLEPCSMCKALLKESRIKNVYYMVPRMKEKKEYDKTNFKKWDCEKEMEEKYKNLLSFFFKKRR